MSKEPRSGRRDVIVTVGGFPRQHDLSKDVMVSRDAGHSMQDLRTAAAASAGH